MYTAAFSLFFLFIGVETLLNQNLERLFATNELKLFVFVDFALWIIFFVIGYVDGTIWSATWPSTRVVGACCVAWVSLQLTCRRINFGSDVSVCGSVGAICCALAISKFAGG